MLSPVVGVVVLLIVGVLAAYVVALVICSGRR
jgi:hypothetical protein